MDLYQKKVNVGNKNRRNPKSQYIETEDTPSKNRKNIYTQKMIPQNDNYDIASGGENISNVRSSMEDLFANEDMKKNAIKYVINLGKNKNIRNSPPRYDGPARRLEKSASPNRGRGHPQGYEDIYEETPNRRFPGRRGESYFNNRPTNQKDYNPITYTGYNNLRKKNKYNNNTNYKNNIRPNLRTQYNDMDDEDYYDNPPPNYINVEESQNEIASMNEDERVPLKLKNVEPRAYNRVKNALNDVYERAAKRVRNKDINVMPKVRKQPKNKYAKNINKNINTDNNTLNTDDEIEELFNTMEELKGIIDDQKKELRKVKKDNYKKDKEIKLLKNDLDNMQKELEDKRIEHDKDIDNIYKNNDNNAKLKKEYFKLLQDYDTNINDYNNLKDDYNKMVDEYNILKNE